MTDLPKRRRGRPSKADIAERERLVAEAEATREAEIQARDEAYLTEITGSETYRRRPTRLQPTPDVLRQIFQLAKIACTQYEIAAVLGVPQSTFNNFLDHHPEARESWEAGIEHAKISLRRKQFRLADKLAPMAIFLGKNMLGQKDVHEVKNTSGKDAAPAMSEEDLLKVIKSGKHAEIKKDEGSTLQ